LIRYSCADRLRLKIYTDIVEAEKHFVIATEEHSEMAKRFAFIKQNAELSTLYPTHSKLCTTYYS